MAKGKLTLRIKDLLKRLAKKRKEINRFDNILKRINKSEGKDA